MSGDIKTIIGIDPGYARTGWGVIRAKGGILEPVAHGCIETCPRQAFCDRLKCLHDELASLIAEHKPDGAGMEKLFFAKNAKTAMDVGQARGVAVLTLIQQGLAIQEFAPSEVKQAITGYGSADKAQMQKMVQLILKLKETPKPDDAADALGIAICAANTKVPLS